MTQLAPRDFKPANSMRNQWDVEAEFGVPPEALLDPSYWAHVSAQLRRKDIIYVLSKDNTYWSELLVIDAGKLFARVVQLRCVKIEPAQMLNVQVPEGFEIKFRGPKKWSVLRGKDVLKDDMDKAQAENWLREHIVANQIKAA